MHTQLLKFYGQDTQAVLGRTCLQACALSEIYQLIRTTDVTNNLNHILHNPLPTTKHTSIWF